MMRCVDKMRVTHCKSSICVEINSLWLRQNCENGHWCGYGNMVDSSALLVLDNLH